ncbi:enterobactin transporter EntS [Phenylobacterium sp. LjRoot225]|uniref:enterobactin transporter EntS n=1 Tax=Phenylobacterium sp. LjRoot225 TaxID=3342285 RepID=UPI003ECD70A3
MASPFLVDFGLLKRNPHFRAVFVARMMSVFSLGILAVAAPVQIHQLTGSALQVSVAVALDGFGMFVGLMVGGVAADRYDRRRLILMARGLCGLGFLALALNGFLAAPSVTALYLVSLWDGFFGAIGMTALMAAIPGLVGRENLAAAGGLSMLTVRFGAVLAPMVGGLIIASAGVSWNYLVAGIGTLGTLIPLVRLPTLRPGEPSGDRPLQALAGGFAFLLQNRIVGAVVAVGTLQATFSAIRVVFPSLAEAFQAGPVGIGLMYSAVPLGAMVGAFTSGWVGGFARPGALLIGCVCSCAALIAGLGWAGALAPALAALVVFGYLGSIASLLQFTLVQTHTPDHLLGRVSGLWSGQDVIGDSGGALAMGGLARLLPPVLGVFWFGAGALALGLGMAASFGNLRQLHGDRPATKAPLEDALAEPAAE